MGASDLDELYDLRILDHSRAPRHAERIEAPDAEGNAINPFCGDEAHIQLTLDEGRVAGIGVQSIGCSINRASASMLAEVVLWRSLEDAIEADRRVRRLMQGEVLSEDEIDSLGELGALDAVRAFPGAHKVRAPPLDGPGRGAGGCQLLTAAALRRPSSG